MPECYHVLGIIHHNWTPLQERIKDYIASPKSNAYQSLHTTIFGPGGELFEVQIRTREMHRTAEYGIAAHWVYKHEGKGDDELDQALGWFRQLIELQQDTHTPEEFLEFLKVDLYQDEIFMFTPRGDVKRLPKGATAIDFAFHVHTEVGLQVPGRQDQRPDRAAAPRAQERRHGRDPHRAHARPSRDWLSHVHTARARHKIKQWIRHEEETVEPPARPRNPDARAPPPPARPAAAAISSSAAPRRSASPSGAALEVAIGRGDLAIGQVIRSLYPDRAARRAAGTEAARSSAGSSTGSASAAGIKIQGVDGLMVRYAQCCQPVPGDPVSRLRHAGARDLDPPGGLPQPAHPERRGAPGRHRLAGGGGGGVHGAAGAVRRGPARALRRHHVGHQRDRHQHPVAPTFTPRTARCSGRSSSRWTTSPHLAKVLKAMRRVKGVVEVERREAPGAPGSPVPPH